MMTLEQAREAGVAYRAPVGGCYAANGEFYIGGQFVNIEKLDEKGEGCAHSRGPVAVGEGESYLRLAGLGEAVALAGDGAGFEAATLRDICGKPEATGWPLSDKQISFALSLIARIQEGASAPAPTPVPVTSERIEITGEVVGHKEVYSQWGCQTKCLVRDDRGFKVFGGYVGARGERVSFFARVRKSDRDEAFGFFERPTKIKEIA